MSRVPKPSLFSPLEPPLSVGTTAPQSPPAMMSLGSGLRRSDSRPANVDSTFYFSPDELDDITGPYSYRPQQRLGQSGNRLKGNAMAGGSSSGRQANKSESSLRGRQGPYSIASGRVGDDSMIDHDYGLYDDLADDMVHYGTPSSSRPSSSYAHPSSAAPTLAGHDVSCTSDAGLPFPSASSPVSATGPRSSGVDSVGVPQAMLQQSNRRAQPPTTPKALSSSAPRRRSSGATPSIAGPGGMRLDSILISSSQITSNTVTPSRENTAKRSSRFIGRNDEDIPNAGSFARGPSGVGNGNGPVSPSASGHRKKVSATVDHLTVSGRSIDSNASSMDASLMVNKGNRSFHVNLAHKALIGKGSYGVVFQAMDRDTNRIIAVKEIALGNAVARGGSSRNFALSGSTGEATKRSVNTEDTVMGSTNGGSSTPASHKSAAAGASKSPTKAGQSTEFHRQLDAVRKELAVLKQLDHPNIVKCLGEECDEGFLRIYMEYVAGGSVTSVIRTFGNLQERQASNFTRQMLEGLTYLHSRGIVHRDLKGDNLLVDTNGTLKLADFGTARDMHVQTHTNAVAGTAYFMAPEVISGDSSDTKSDIWSVGCCVIEMLSGKPPLSELTNQYSIMMLIADSKGELVDRYIPPNNGWSPQVLDFLRRCLTRNPAKRPTAQQLLTHPWIMHPTRDNTIRSPFTTALTATAIANLPSPPPIDRLRGSEFYSDGSQHSLFGGTVNSSVAETDTQSITPTSERSRKHKKDKKAKREKEKEKEKERERHKDREREKEKRRSSGGASSSSSSNRRHQRREPDLAASLSQRGEEYSMNSDAFLLGTKHSAQSNSGATSPPTTALGGGGLISPRWLTRESKRGQMQASLRGASLEGDPLPDIRVHNSVATSTRSPFLPSLSGDRTPCSAHATTKSSSNSQRGAFVETGSSRRVKGGGGGIGTMPAVSGGGMRGSGYDVMSAKDSSHLTKSASGSGREAETPMKGARRDPAIIDDVVVGKDDSIRYASNNRLIAIAAPQQSSRRQKGTGSPRMSSLSSPKAKKK